MAPHKKGRARDVVPHREHRTSKKATGKSNSPLIAPSRAGLVVATLELDSLPLPAELWLRTMACLDVMEICCCEISSKALWDVLNRENTLWQKLCTLHFPSMYSSVCTNPMGCPVLSNISNIPMDLPGKPVADMALCEGSPDFQTLPPVAQVEAIDWKMLFARRWQKQRKWERDRCRTQSSMSTGVTRRCTACGELCEDETESDCAVHPGDFLPRQAADWSRVELQQLQSYARAAWRSIGTTAIQRSARVYRGGGYWAKGIGFKGWGSKGHWAEGLGARPGPGNLRLCIIGHVPCTWTCCGAEDLISEGCLLGQHRLR